ncbi:hypothetical protein FANTH_8964 [Fusarium anthophilum]|uniref:Alpha/beta hydrolase fold-3 domain-containing protein n=1 Tax=Fusarium anthophilum TaxID=48485 RepID=A0A8H5DZR0_9HYPO|nr:hypothetical protein FANTH_8964 [Fusarium anthophilum]
MRSASVIADGAVPYPGLLLVEGTSNFGSVMPSVLVSSNQNPCHAEVWIPGPQYPAGISSRSKEAKKFGHQQYITRLVYDREVLEDGKSSLLWIGDRKQAKKVVLFFHGGGFAAPMTTGHLDWCWRAYVLSGIEKGVEAAVAVLEYTLIPEARYPVQLRQAASGLAHLLHKGISPQDIIIGGDSAGG